jgi:hypothetical protein
LHFVAGDHSLARAYSQQSGRGGTPYGAIYPAALEAMRQVGPGKRIWSMHIHSYCLAPECRVESVVSFKMSRHLSQILNGRAEEAAAYLKQGGLNYFFSRRS